MRLYDQLMPNYPLSSDDVILLRRLEEERLREEENNVASQVQSQAPVVSLTCASNNSIEQESKIPF